MKRRALFRLALGSLALYGCASVLGIDELPEADVVAGDGGTPDSARPTADGATDTTEGSAPFDASVPDGTTPPDPSDAGADADADANDGGPPRKGTITAGINFDPSSVVWDKQGNALFIADSFGSGQILRWQDGDATPSLYVALTLEAGERIGQIVLAGETLYVPVYASGGGFVWKIVGQGTPVLVGNQGDSYNAASVATSFVLFANRNATTPHLVRIDLTTGVPNPVGSTLPAPETGIVALSDNEFFLLSQKEDITHVVGGAAVAYSVPSTIQPGYMISGPNNTLIAGSGTKLVAYSKNGGNMTTLYPNPMPGTGTFHDLGAFTYDDTQSRLFVPEGRGTGGSPAGDIIYFPVSN